MAIFDFLQSNLRIFDLSVPLENGMPTSGAHPAFHHALVRRHGDKSRPGSGGGTSANDIFVSGGHVGTHIDAIGHVARDGKLHGGVDAVEATRGGRFNVMGVDTIKPMVCRGVLLDIPALKGVEHLDPAYGITAEDLEQALGDTEINEGDVVLVRTGWLKLYHDERAFLGEETGVPGVTEPAAEWLVSKGVRAAGTDTMAFDQIVPGPKKLARPAHGVLLWQHAVHIIELLDLEELAAARIKEFLFFLAPLKMTGGTGSPVRPLAIIEE
ncbi:uncharacterized protein A1O9_02312 [Exophiala aquamarina CBS 119918]|uniref:Cyclase n=1 Tax=Exophiala aquamarina CBS 119918 TaxID=1182545 RepID=A0A072PLL9_9EURO|nr:uncharacterized protein A1O9_02312 [Exophiala aquamarina CBS 119918]KEF60751.1 hypothetical protein A1O9_02312 [Exophiala aquamarina CBS 119918]